MVKIEKYYFTDLKDESFHIVGRDKEGITRYDKVLKMGTREQKAFSKMIFKRKTNEDYVEKLAYLSTWELTFK